MKKILLFIFTILACGLAATSQTFAEELPEIYIKAINPGYTVDGVQNVGEFIELARSDVASDTPIPLAGLNLGYTNSSGNTVILYEFPENFWMTGETILLRLASSPEQELADLNYSKTLAFKAGPLELTRGEEILDSVCWTSKEGCVKEFKSSSPTTLVRNLETLEFVHLTDYSPSYNPDNPNYYLEETGYGAEEETPLRQCYNLEFSEILSYYESAQSEQFIEFYNPTSEQIPLDGCQIKYKNKYYALTGVVKPDGYYFFTPTEFALTKNPTTSNTLELIDTDGSTVATLTYPNGQKKSTSYARIGYDATGAEIWQNTYAPTPGEANNYQEFKTCEAGKIINESTGNCVKITEVATKVCEEGKYLNPLTGRCKSYETTTEKTCKEGYELNPDTNRCRLIKTNDGAEYALEEESGSESSVFVAIYAIIGVAALAVIYVIFEFRHEIKKFFDKVFQSFRRKPRP